MELQHNAKDMVLWATEYLRAGLSVIPVKRDKTPTIAWKIYMERKMSEQEACVHFGNENRIALVCGAVSGSLEAIDMDLKYDLTSTLKADFEAIVKQYAPSLLPKLVIQSSENGGLHYLYRCEKTEGNQKLAKRHTNAQELQLYPHQQTKVLIETRGEGGYLIVNPTPKYELLQGDLRNIPFISVEEREILHKTALLFNEVLEEKKPIHSLAPWEDYNEKANVLTLLASHGWSVVWQKGERIALKRAGDSSSLHSGYYHTGLNLFSVFSTSTPFEVGKGYKPAAVFAILECGGDFEQTARELRALGYGSIIEAIAPPQPPTFHEILLNAPYLPEGIYKVLPKTLANACERFSNQREKDAFLISALSVLGGCFHSLSSTYHKRTIYPNLFTFIVAPAANGKGVIIYAKTLAEGYDKRLRRESYEAQKEYEVALMRYQEALRKKEAMELDIPQKPPIKALFIPGDSSSASVKQLLAATEGIGVMFETEADTISNALKKDYGGYSDLLRKCFQHENISYARKVTEEYVVIDKPKLSLSIAGTPNQICNLITSFEDGLFSRFIFYCFTSPHKWEDVSASESDNLDMYFDKVGQTTTKWINHIQNHPFSFNLTPQQWVKFNQTFERYLHHYTAEAGDIAASIVKRQGNIAFRIAMILTALEYADKGVKQSTKTSFCKDEHCEVALQFAEISIQHALILFRQFAKSQTPIHAKQTISPLAMKLLASLPATFTRKEATEIGKSLGISSSAVDKYLQKLSPSHILKSEIYGKYMKVN